MELNTLILNAISSFFATFGFAIILNVERKKAVITGFTGTVSWMSYIILYNFSNSDYLSLVLASLVLTINSEILAKKMKTPSTVFSIAALIPLVPGAYIYYTVLAAVNGNLAETSSLLYTTIIKSVSIAIGMLIGGGVISIRRRLKKVTRIDFMKGLRNE